MTKCKDGTEICTTNLFSACPLEEKPTGPGEELNTCGEMGVCGTSNVCGSMEVLHSHLPSREVVMK